MGDDQNRVLIIPWTPPSPYRRRKIIQGEDEQPPAVLEGGTLSGGTTKLMGGTFVCHGGTLSGVTYDGTLDLSGSGASVHLASGTVVNDAAGRGAGPSTTPAKIALFYFDNTQTFNNATINLGSRSGGDSLNEYDSTGAGTVLTLGSNVTIDESGDGEITEYHGRRHPLHPREFSFTNSVTITAGSSGGALTIDTITFTNSGTLAISNADAVTIDAANLSNSGGTVSIQGTLDNTGGTINGSNGLGQAVRVGGTVQGGTVTLSGLVLTTVGGTLSSVTYDGTLDLSGSGDSNGGVGSI